MDHRTDAVSALERPPYRTLWRLARAESDADAGVLTPGPGLRLWVTLVVIADRVREARGQVPVGGRAGSEF